MIEHYDGVITLELKDVTSGDTYYIVEYVSDLKVLFRASFSKIEWAKRHEED